MAFVEWPKKPFVRHLERKGYALRRRLKLRDLDRLDPFELIRTYENMRLLDLRTLDDGHAAHLDELRIASKHWSAIAYRQAGGPWLISWNPWHAETRTRVSLLEEVGHIILNHRPTALVPDSTTGLPRREFTPSKEKEAYGVAGAALLPYNGLIELLRRGWSENDIGEHFGASQELTQMRLNVTSARRAA
jgi:hypothetical protein